MINRDRFRCVLRQLEKEYGEVYTSENKSLFMPYINRLLYQCEILNDTDYEEVTLYFLNMLALSNRKLQNIDALSLIQKTYEFYPKINSSSDIDFYQNDGKPHSMQSADPADYEIIAGRFSEGSNALKDLLIFLWNHGIMTRACCAGHVGKPDKYIMLDYMSNTDEIVNICFQCNQMLTTARLNLVKKFDIFNEVKYSIGIHSKDLNAESFFTEVKQTFMRYFTEPCYIPNTFYEFFDVFFSNQKRTKGSNAALLITN